MKQFNPGDLVEILTDRTASTDGLTIAHTCDEKGIQLYTEIRMSSYPSYNDFVGATIRCDEGQTGNVVRFVGRPIKIKEDDRLWEYDVYEVLVKGVSAQIFAANLALINRVA